METITDHSEAERMRVVSWNVNGDSRVCPARVRGFCGPVRRRYCRRPGGPCAARGHPPGPPVGRRAGTRRFTVAERRGYSGVGLYSKLQPVRVDTSLGVPRFDREGRFMAAHFQTGPRAVRGGQQLLPQGEAARPGTTAGSATSSTSLGRSSPERKRCGAGARCS